jgi:glutamine amidotransferase
MYPDNENLIKLPDEARVIVSEPLTDLPGLFDEVPENTIVTMTRAGIEQRAFRTSTVAA